MSNETRLSFLDNQQVKAVSLPEKDPAVRWHLYWLKKTEYNAQVHAQFKGAAPHHHSFFEMHLITQGNVEYRIGEKLIRLDSGDFLLISPKTEHLSVSHSDILKKLSIGFDMFPDGEDLFGTRLNEIRCIPYFSGQDDGALSAVLELILSDPGERTLLGGYLRRTMLNAFLITLLRMIPSAEEVQHSEEACPVRSEISDETLYQSVVQYLQANIGKNVSLEETSDYLLISISQLNRRLIRYSKMSFSGLKDQVRISRARELLATNLSLGQIGAAVGISNEYSFNRFFKRVEGMTPGQFREALQTNNYK